MHPVNPRHGPRMRRIRSLLTAGRGIAWAAWLSVAAALPGAAETRLLMFDSPGCPWCAAWEAEIGPAYPGSPEGRAAPLERVRLGTEVEGVALAAPPRVTPTFVLVDDGVEVGRIEGYPGAEFFWPMLGRLLDRLPKAGPAEDGGKS